MTPAVCVYPRQKLSTLAAWVSDGGDVYHYALLRQFVDSVFHDFTALTAAASLGAIDYGKYFVNYATSGVTVYIKNSVNPNLQNYFIYVIYRRYFAEKEYDLVIDGTDVQVGPWAKEIGTITRAVSRMGGTIELGMHTFSIMAKIAAMYALELKNQRVEVVDLETMAILYRGYISETNYSAVSNVLSITSESGMFQQNLVAKPTLLGDCIVEPEFLEDRISPTVAGYRILDSNYYYLGDEVLALYDNDIVVDPAYYTWYTTWSPPYTNIWIEIDLTSYDIKGTITAQVNSSFKAYDFATGLPTAVLSKNIADYLYYMFSGLMGESCNLTSFGELQAAGYTTNMLLDPDTDIKAAINSLLVSSLCYAVRDTDYKIELKMHNKAVSPEIYIPLENVTDWQQKQDTVNYGDIIIVQNDQAGADLTFNLGPGNVTKTVEISVETGGPGVSWAIANLVYASGEQFQLSGVVGLSPVRPGQKIWMEVDGANYYMISERIEFDLSAQTQTIYCGKDYAPEAGGALSADGTGALSPDGTGMIGT